MSQDVSAIVKDLNFLYAFEKQRKEQDLEEREPLLGGSAMGVEA